MTLFKWSTNAANNATADSTCPFPEGMPAAGLNDGARGQMAAVAKYRDDIAGIIVTGGTSTAYTISSNQGFGSLVQMHGAMIAFTPHVTNGANGSNLSVDGLPVKPILVAPGAGLPGGVLVQGTPYAVLYNNTDGAFYLHGAGGVTGIPLGCGMDFWGSAAPSSMFAFPVGQQVSQTTYAALYTLFGPNRYGADAGGLFFLPNRQGRVSAQMDPSGTVLTGAAVAPSGNTLGAKGGEQFHTLTAAELAPHTHNGGGVTGTSNQSLSHSHPTVQMGGIPSGGGGQFGGASNLPSNTGATEPPAHNHNFNFTTDGGNGVFGAAHNNTQPTIVCNYIIRIL